MMAYEPRIHFAMKVKGEEVAQEIETFENIFPYRTYPRTMRMDKPLNFGFRYLKCETGEHVLFFIVKPDDEAMMRVSFPKLERISDSPSLIMVCLINKSSPF